MYQVIRSKEMKGRNCGVVTNAVQNRAVPSNILYMSNTNQYMKRKTKARKEFPANSDLLPG